MRGAFLYKLTLPADILDGKRAFRDSTLWQVICTFKYFSIQAGEKENICHKLALQ